MADNGQVRVEWRPGFVKLMIFTDDGNCRWIELPAGLASHVGHGIIQAAAIAGVNRGVEPD